MKTTILKTTILAASILVMQDLNAQTNSPEQKKVKVIIKENVNGKEDIIEADELTPEIKQKLKEKGVNVDELEALEKGGRKIVIKNNISGDENSEEHSKVFIKINDGADPEIRKQIEGNNVEVITRDGESKIVIDGKEVHSIARTEGDNKKFVKVFVKMIDVKDASSEERKKAGIPENKGQLVIKDVNCTPNPSTGKFILEFSGPDKTPAEINIRDVNGKVVYTESIKDFNGSYSKELDLNNGAKGIYFVTIQQGKKAITKKMIIE